MRQNGNSSWIETGVGLLRPITLNWLFGKSCAVATETKAAARAETTQQSIEHVQSHPFPVHAEISNCTQLAGALLAVRVLPSGLLKSASSSRRDDVRRLPLSFQVASQKVDGEKIRGLDFRRAMPLRADHEHIWVGTQDAGNGGDGDLARAP